MPSPRPSRFRGEYAEPASDGLNAPAQHHPSKRDRNRAKHPAQKTGRMKDEAREALVESVMTGLTKNPSKLAIEAGRGSDGRVVKAVIKQARRTLASNVEFYVEAHKAATAIAAAQGDAGPAQWALEHISEGGERVIDPPGTGASKPGIQIGVLIGGIPKPQLPDPVKPSDLPDLVIEATDNTP